MTGSDRHFGAPCRFELRSVAIESTLTFFECVFGWRRGGGATWSSTGGHVLSNSDGAVCLVREAQRGEPWYSGSSHWVISFSVDDCDATTARALALGAVLVSPATGVGSLGRGSVLIDPTGATFGLWQAMSSDSAIAMFDNHAITWVELATRDSEGARTFYAALFGWTYAETQIPVAGAGRYTEIAIGARRVGGIIPMNHEWGEIQPHWGVYVMVDDVEACIERAERCGGANTLPPFDAPGVGRISMIADPSGASCYIIRLNQRVTHA